MDRKDRINQVLQHFGIAYSALAVKSGLNPSNLKKMLDGDQTITDKTLHRIANTFPQINIDWLKTGEGEMLLKNPPMIQNGDGRIRQQGTAGHDLTQTNNSEKILKEFIEGLKSSNGMTKQAMAQTDRAMSQTDKALVEISEQRKLVDRLITIIEKR